MVLILPLTISFYLYRASLDPNQQPLILVPTKQFEHFLATINRSLNTNLTIPTGGANDAFQVIFENDGTPQPRYLGRSTDREMADNLKDNVPPRHYRYVYFQLYLPSTIISATSGASGRSLTRSSLLKLVVKPR